MNREEFIRYAHIFLDMSLKDDEHLVAYIISRGINLSNAERYVAFMPIAFGRVVINKIADVKFKSTYRTYESTVEYLLTDEPIYNIALAVAENSYSSGEIGREIFSAIATRSAELNAVNKALNEGVDINGGESNTVLFFGYKTLGKKRGL